MIEEFTIPRWARLLTRLAERRLRRATNYRRPSRSIETREEILAALKEPFWDPVVEVVDPWRRPVNIAAFDTSAHEMPVAPADWPLTSVPVAPLSTASSELATRLTPAAATPPTTSIEDDRLTRQLLATARALSVTWARDVKAADPDVPAVATEAPTVAADIAPADSPAVAPSVIADAPATTELPPPIAEETPPTADVVVASALQEASTGTLEIKDQATKAESAESTVMPDEVAVAGERVSPDVAGTAGDFEAVVESEAQSAPEMPIGAADDVEPPAAAISADDVRLQLGIGVSAGVFGTATVAPEGFAAAAEPLEPAVHLAEAAAAIESVSERGPVRRAEPDEMHEAEDVLENQETQSEPIVVEPVEPEATPSYVTEPIDAEPASSSDPSPSVAEPPPVDEPAELASEALPEPMPETVEPTRAEEPLVAEEPSATAEAVTEEEAEIAAPLSEATAAMPEAAATVAETVDLALAEPEASAMERLETSPDKVGAASTDERQAAVPAAESVVAETPVIDPPSTTEPTKPTEQKSEVAKQVAAAIKSAASTVMAPAVRDEYNRTNVDFRRPMPRPKVRGKVIDFHCHLLARRHAEDWFEAADHYGIDNFLTMSPLEEAVSLSRDWGHRIRFIAVPQWADTSDRWVDNWRLRIEGFYNLGSRIAKFHSAPGTMAMRGHRLDSPVFEPLFKEVTSRGMAIMTHIGDPDTWYNRQYADRSKFGSRQEHYQMWETLLEAHRGHTWIGAHLGGNPEDLPRLQRLLDKFPDLWLDCSATRWMVREISARREPAREFFIRNADRILFGSDQVSGDDRHFDFLASRFWCHRKLWETAYIGPSPIIDPDLPNDEQPVVRGLALPDIVLQKIYHDNPTKLLAKIGMSFQ